MILLDVYLHWSAASDGAEERFEVFEAACAVGEAAFASEHQLFILTEMGFDEAARRLQGARGQDLFLKIQEVAGRFVLTGAYPDSVHQLIERAGELGAVALDRSARPDPALTPQSKPTGVWLH